MHFHWLVEMSALYGPSTYGEVANAKYCALCTPCTPTHTDIWMVTVLGWDGWWRNWPSCLNVPAFKVKMRILFLQTWRFHILFVFLFVFLISLNFIRLGSFLLWHKLTLFDFRTYCRECFFYNIKKKYCDIGTVIFFTSVSGKKLHFFSSTL